MKGEGALVRCRLRKGTRSEMWVGGWVRGERASATELPPGSRSISTLPCLCPSPQVLGEFSPVFPLPHAPAPGVATRVGVGWGEASLSCLKDGGAGEVGLGAQTAACVGGDVLRCPPPGSPRSDVWVPPLSLPGLVAAWPDSPGLLSPPPPAALPWAGGCSTRRALVLAQVRGSGDSVRAAGSGVLLRVSAGTCVSVCVCQCS